MREADHLVTALFTRAPWNVDSPDYTRNGRLMRNQDGFAVDADSQLTLDGVAAQISAKVAELCGHAEGGEEEPLASFGLTSISVAELGAFIQMQFNHQVSALELMTTASTLSLAQAIVHGEPADGEAQTEAETERTPTRRAMLRSAPAAARSSPTRRKTTFPMAPGPAPGPTPDRSRFPGMNPAWIRHWRRSVPCHLCGAPCRPIVREISTRCAGSSDPPFPGGCRSRRFRPIRSAKCS